MSRSLSYFKAVTFLLVTFRIKNIVSFCVKKLLHFALKSCYILRQKLFHFGLMFHFESKVVTFRVNVTFCVNCNILRRSKGSWHFSHCINLLRNHEVMRKFCFLKTESYHGRACFLKSWLYSLSLKKKDSR